MPLTMNRVPSFLYKCLPRTFTTSSIPIGRMSTPVAFVLEGIYYIVSISLSSSRRPLPFSFDVHTRGPSPRRPRLHDAASVLKRSSFGHSPLFKKFMDRLMHAFREYERSSLGDTSVLLGRMDDGDDDQSSSC